MAKYNIEIELDDRDVWSALEWTQSGSHMVSSGTHMDVKAALFDALKKQVCKYSLDMEMADDIDDPDDKARFLEDMGYDAD